MLPIQKRSAAASKDRLRRVAVSLVVAAAAAGVAAAIAFNERSVGRRHAPLFETAVQWDAVPDGAATTAAAAEPANPP